MRRTMMVLLALVLAACGGGDTSGDDTGVGTDTTAAGAESDQSDNGGDDGATGSDGVIDPGEAGQATVSVDGEEWTFDLPAQSDCILESDTITFGFLMSDTANTIAGGANLTDDGWLGDIRTTVINDELQPVSYYPADGAMDDGITIGGESMSFSGPMLKKPPNDGTNPPAEEVGEGTISVTCG